MRLFGVAFGKQCPRCRGNSMERMQRKNWMRWIPRTKYYRCKACRARFLVLSEVIAVKTKS